MLKSIACFVVACSALIGCASAADGTGDAHPQEIAVKADNAGGTAPQSAALTNCKKGCASTYQLDCNGGDRQACIDLRLCNADCVTYCSGSVCQ